MKKRGKILIIVALIAFLLIPVTASAYSGSYSFDIYSAVHGTKKHSLSAKKTSTTVKANTYLGNTNNILSTKEKYQVQIYGGLLKNYMTPKFNADGYSKSHSFGKIKSGSYTVSVYKSTDYTYGSRVKGSGTIRQ